MNRRSRLPWKTRSSETFGSHLLIWQIAVSQNKLLIASLTHMASKMWLIAAPNCRKEPWFQHNRLLESGWENYCGECSLRLAFDLTTSANRVSLRNSQTEFNLRGNSSNVERQRHKSTYSWENAILQHNYNVRKDSRFYGKMHFCSKQLLLCLYWATGQIYCYDVNVKIPTLQSKDKLICAYSEWSRH